MYRVDSCTTVIDLNVMCNSEQPRFARFLKQDFCLTSSVTAILQENWWEKLEERRSKARITMLFRIKTDLVDIPVKAFLVKQPSRGEKFHVEFRVPYARTQQS